LVTLPPLTLPHALPASRRSARSSKAPRLATSPSPCLLDPALLASSPIPSNLAKRFAVERRVILWRKSG
jgi:hypothetical protein